MEEIKINIDVDYIKELKKNSQSHLNILIQRNVELRVKAKELDKEITYNQRNINELRRIINLKGLYTRN